MKHAVLVVDDVDICVELVATVLEKAGYEVLHAADGLQAIEMMEARLPDAIVLDMELPRLGGRDFLRHLRHRREWSSLPVIVFSGSSSDETMSALHDLDVDDCLVKGQDSMAKLLASLQTAVARRPAPN